MGEESCYVGKSRLLHKRPGFDCDIFLYCFKVHMMRRKKGPLQKGFFWDSRAGAMPKGVRSVLRQECYIFVCG